MDMRDRVGRMAITPTLKIAHMEYLPLFRPVDQLLHMETSKEGIQISRPNNSRRISDVRSLKTGRSERL